MWPGALDILSHNREKVLDVSDTFVNFYFPTRSGKAQPPRLFEEQKF
jgi:hypothetical protein